MTRPEDTGPLGPFRRARARLGLSPEASSSALKTAYRRAVAEHPPDRDPAGFREIREAYELLTDPLARVKAILEHPAPHHPAPTIELRPPPGPEVGSMHVPERLLRLAVGALSTSDALALAASCRADDPVSKDSGGRR